MVTEAANLARRCGPTVSRAGAGPLRGQKVSFLGPGLEERKSMASRARAKATESLGLAVDAPVTQHARLTRPGSAPLASYAAGRDGSTTRPHGSLEGQPGPRDAGSDRGGRASGGTEEQRRPGSTTGSCAAPDALMWDGARSRPPSGTPRGEQHTVREPWPGPAAPVGRLIGSKCVLCGARVDAGHIINCKQTRCTE